MSTITVDGVDNRGTDTCPFGFVYLDNTRGGFARGNGVFLVQQWAAATRHLKAAHAHLDEVMPGWNDLEESA